MPTFHIQLRAVMALAKASFKAMLHSPVSVVLSLLFPFIFVVVFGSMVDTRIVPLKIALEPGCDTANVIYRTIAETDNITIECFTKRKACRDHQYKDTLASPIAVERNHCEGFQMGITKNYSDHEPVRQPMSHT